VSVAAPAQPLRTGLRAPAIIATEIAAGVQFQH